MDRPNEPKEPIKTETDKIHNLENFFSLSIFQAFKDATTKFSWNRLTATALLFIAIFGQMIGLIEKEVLDFLGGILKIQIPAIIGYSGVVTVADAYKKVKEKKKEDKEDKKKEKNKLSLTLEPAKPANTTNDEPIKTNQT